MTQDELVNQLAVIYDSLNQIDYERKLLDMAVELSKDFSQENFDRVNLLLDCFRSRLEGSLADLIMILPGLMRHIQSARGEQ